MDTNYFEKQKNRISGSVSLKLTVIGILSLLLLIPSGMIKNLISEREMRQRETIEEVTSKWGNAQTICGPVLTVPYLTYYKTKTGVRATRNFAHVLPGELSVNGDLIPEIRKRGIYKVIAYNTKLNFSGFFNPLDFSEWKVKEDDILWNEAYVTIGVTDMRGIKKEIQIEWCGIPEIISPGLKSKDIVTSGVTAHAPVKSGESCSFSFNIDLNGSHYLNFIPLGKETNVKLRSTWSTPSFDGMFLPENHEITDTGFVAQWNILQLNRNYPQQWTGDEFEIKGSEFGVKLLFPVDTYQKATRSVKYSLLFISLTFLVFFFSEVLSKKRIHAVQYLLVGVALVVFYSLLIALSEHIDFNLAFLFASAATISLVTVFTHAVFRNRYTTLSILSVLTALYVFLFTILQLSDYSLLLGNVGLFIVLAIVMYFSVKINWYGGVSVRNGEAGE
ncbi:MAG: cell envelope integrity protein CreD [Bacteroidales bacterium]|nr:cell envelope integrity protein CreD [Bacteroidales bacterium]